MPDEGDRQADERRVRRDGLAEQAADLIHQAADRLGLKCPRGVEGRLRRVPKLCVKRAGRLAQLGTVMPAKRRQLLRCYFDLSFANLLQGGQRDLGVRVWLRG